MKKLIATIFLFILLFNIGGPLAFHEYLVYKSDKLFSRQISLNHYNIDDLTEIRIQVNMPGISDWRSYENLHGRVQFENTAYNYVKIKMTRNAIYLVCIPNYATTHLSDQNIINARQIPDIPVPKKDHVPFGKINLASYNCLAIHYKFSIPIIKATQNIDTNHSYIPDPCVTGSGQPPDFKFILSYTKFFLFADNFSNPINAANIKAALLLKVCKAHAGL